MMNEVQSIRGVAFLDTNTLHEVGLYLTHAKSNSLYPFSTEDNAIEESKRRLREVAEKGLARTLKRGLETIDFLSREDVQVEYSPVSELELVVGRVRGAAIVSAAKEGIPSRMWSKIQEEEIRERISGAELVDLKTRVEDLSTLLENSGIEITATDAYRTRDVLELAKGIVGLVYLDAVDSIIYASALIAEADYLVTRDMYLRETANLIQRPDGKTRYERTRLRLQELVNGTIGGDSNERELPRAFMITADGKLDPPFP